MFTIILAVIVLPKLYVSGCGPQIDQLLAYSNDLQTSEKRSPRNPFSIPSSSGTETSYPEKRYNIYPGKQWVIPRKRPDEERTTRQHGNRPPTVHPEHNRRSGYDIESQRRMEDGIPSTDPYRGREQAREEKNLKRVRFAPESPQQPTDSRYSNGDRQNAQYPQQGPPAYGPSADPRVSRDGQRRSGRRYIGGGNSQEKDFEGGNGLVPAGGNGAHNPSSRNEGMMPGQSGNRDHNYARRNEAPQTHPSGRLPRHTGGAYHSPPPMQMAVDGDDPNTWVMPQDRVYPMPENVVVPLFILGDTYVGFVTIGTPKEGEEQQLIKVKFDTGAPFIWALSEAACTRQLCQRGLHTPYVNRASTSYTHTRKHMKASFRGTDFANGIIAGENFIFGLRDNMLSLNAQPFCETMDFKGVFDTYDLLFGLALQHPSVRGGRTDAPLLTMTSQFGSAPVFSVYLSSYTTEDSVITFGENLWERKYVQGEFSSHSVVKVNVEGYGPVYNGWNLGLNALLVDDESPEAGVFTVPRGFIAEVNTGHKYISGPEAQMRPLNQQIFKNAWFPVQEDFSYDCSLDVRKVWTTLPRVAIVIDGIKYVLTPDDYLGIIDEKCISLFRPSDDMDSLVLGYPFLTKFYTKFDYRKRQVHFAVSNQAPHPIAALLETIRVLHQGPQIVEIR